LFARSLFTGKEREVLSMENGGNQKVNAIFEARLSVEKPTNHADLQTRERYVRDKYERRKFYDPAFFSTAPSRPAARPAKAQKEISLPALRTGPVGVPSEVAQRRIEERRLRHHGISPKEGEKSLRRVGSASGPDSSSPSKKKSSSRSKKNASSNPSSSVDLLDFGNTPSPQAAAAPPSDDLFGFLETEDPRATARSGQVFDSFASTTALDGGAPRSGTAAADIMALYSSGGDGNANHAPSNGFGGQPPGNNHGYPNGGGMPANGGGNMLNARMQNMNLNQQSVANNQQRGHTMTPQQQHTMTPQQQQVIMMQQQQQMMMMMQQQQRMGQQNGSFRAQQQQQQQQGFGGMNGMAQTDGFGGQMMGGGMGQQQQQATTTKKEDPFASLGGRNFFR
jgi:hypothetical protein